VTQVTEELFYAEDSRQVKKDNTFSFKNTRYEAPADFRGKTIHIRFSRSKAGGPLIVYYKNGRMGEAKILNLIANGQLRRGKQNKEGEKSL
jgi:hypothetical protein